MASSPTTSYLPRLIVQHLYTIRHFSCELHKLLMGWVLVDVVVPIFRVLEFDHEAMCVRVLLRRSGNLLKRASFFAYRMAFRAVVLAAGEGLDVWRLGGGVKAFLAEREHAVACLCSIRQCPSWCQVDTHFLNLLRRCRSLPLEQHNVDNCHFVNA